MRGKVAVCIDGVVVIRITPAYAGKRNCCLAGCRHVQDHPRLCGEKPERGLFSSVTLGSPPPMRGKGGGIAAVLAADRITPAYAGKSQLNRIF